MTSPWKVVFGQQPQRGLRECFSCASVHVSEHLFASDASSRPQPGLRILKSGFRGLKSGLKSFKPGLRSFKPGLRSLKPGLKSLKASLCCFIPGLRASNLASVTCRLASVDCGLQGFCAVLAEL